MDERKRGSHKMRGARGASAQRAYRVSRDRLGSAIAEGVTLGLLLALMACAILL